METPKNNVIQLFGKVPKGTRPQPPASGEAEYLDFVTTYYCLALQRGEEEVVRELAGCIRIALANGTDIVESVPARAAEFILSVTWLDAQKEFKAWQS